MKIAILLLLTLIVAAGTTMAQTTKDADPKDVGSLDAIMKAVYDCISGDAGQARNWDRFRSLFHPDARLIPAGKSRKTGIVGAKAYTPDEYITASSPAFAKVGFYEIERARRVEQYGAIAHVFSTYESRHAPADKTPFERGINSFQLVYDGKRWWVMTILWFGETPDTPIPDKYLETPKN